MSMKPQELVGQGREDLIRFFHEVFGWHENTVLGSPGKALVVGWDDYEPAVFLLGHNEQMTAPGQDHFALGVDSVADLENVLAHADAFAATDTRAEVRGHHINDYGVAKLHNIYVRYLIPMTIEVQHLEVLEH